MCDDNDPYSKVTLQGGQKASFFPTKRFCIPVDKKACLKNGVVRPEDAIYMQDSIKWEIEARMLQKADLVVLDVLASNINTRPIYWAITTGTEAYINMQSYFQLEGLTYRLLPIFTPAGFGTEIAEGKEVRSFNGKPHVLEFALTADFAIVKAWKGDTEGNLIFNAAARNFNPLMAMAGKITIAEVEELVPAGSLDPNQIHTPGIFVQRIFQGEKFQKRIEQRTVRQKV